MSASISTPVCAVVRTRASIVVAARGRRQLDVHAGNRQRVAERDERRGLLGRHDAGEARRLQRIALLHGAAADLRSASRDIRIDPRAIASRSVTGLSPTSTIFTRPRRST